MDKSAQNDLPEGRKGPNSGETSSSPTNNVGNQPESTADIGARTTSKGTLNSYKKLPFGTDKELNNDSKPAQSRTAGTRSDYGPGSRSVKSAARSDNTSVSRSGKHGGANKLANSYLGTKIQPAWETRTFNINPVTSDDLSRFLRNEQHTQRWSIISQIYYILFYNIRRLPFLWGIFIFLCEVLVPIWLPKGIPKKAWYSTAVPLFVCLFMSVFVNLLEFKKRYNLGRFIDNKKCILLKDGKLSTVRSGNVVVGNILKLNCDDQIPADAVVLYSSNPDGALYLDTCFLDGQTDLKTKYSVKDSKMESSLRSYHNLKGNIVCDKPCADMNKFSGLLKIKGYPRPSVINIDNFIMRGSILRNTSHIYAVVVYTGPDTKASQNFLRILKPIKIGCLEHTINKISIILGLIYLFCTMLSITVRYVNVVRGIGKFNKNVLSPLNSLVFIIYRFTILYAPIIPMTLPAVMDLLRLLYLPFYDSYVSFEAIEEESCIDPSTSFGSIDPLVKSRTLNHTSSASTNVNGKKLPGKKSMKKKKTNLIKKDHNNNGTWTLNSGLCEELGLVDFIFTDKTGTLTTNNLDITLVTISNRSYTPKQLVQMYRSASLAESRTGSSVGHRGYSRYSGFGGFSGRFPDPYPGYSDKEGEEGGSSSCATSCQGSSNYAPETDHGDASPHVGSGSAGSNDRINSKSSAGSSNNPISTHPIDAVRVGSYKHDNEDADIEISFIREHFMRMLCICNPCLNVHDGESTNTLSSGFNTTFSRASSFKLNNLQARSYNLNAPSLELNDHDIGDQEGNQLESLDFGGDSLMLKSNESASGVKMEGGPDSSDRRVLDNEDDTSKSDEVSGEKSVKTEIDKEEKERDDEEEDKDDVDDLPLFKKSKSKAHFGTVSYINLDHRNMESDFFDFKEYDTIPELEEKRYLNCISKEDECMVNLANESGYLVVNRTKERIMVNCNGNFVNYDVIGVNEFTSSRKRMSVVVTNLCNEENYLYVKGEGSSMLSCIKDPAVRASVDSRIKKNSLFGYRVIICGYKSLTSTELLDYQAQVSAHAAAVNHTHHSVHNPTNNPNAVNPNRTALINELDEKYLNQLEDDIEYLGIIMFRDEIQRDITSAIDLLMDAGIRIWVLTGDNKESTIQTCYLTKLLNVPTRLFNVQFVSLMESYEEGDAEHGPGARFEPPNAFDPSKLYEPPSRFDPVNPYDPEGYAQEKIDQAEKRYDAVCDNIYNKFLIEKSNRNSEQMCLVIESKDLDEMMRSVKGQNILVNMACSADVVLGCLLTPVQKGRLVQLVRSKLVPTPITLAIGDGINDIHMLQHSHISICLQPSNDNRFSHMEDGMGFGAEGGIKKTNTKMNGGHMDSYSATDLARGGTNVNGSDSADASESTVDKAENAKSRIEQANLLHHNNLIDSHELHRDDHAYKSENYFIRAQKKIVSNDVIGYCDFCIDNFSNLTNLLFLQGTRILRAMSLVIYFTLFKSLILMLPLFYYQMFTNWVGLDLYGSFINIVYNLVFTLLPLVFVVLFHQDVNSDLYRRLPILYTLSRRRIYLNMTNSLFWIAEGIIGSLITYFPLHLLIVSNDNVFKMEIITNRTFGLIVSVSSIIIFNTRLLVTYTPNSLLMRVLSVGYFFLSVPIYLGLTFVSGKRALGISSFQVIRIVPFYLLVPVWVTFTVVVGILSNMLQMYLLPSLTKYLKAYLNKIRETTMGDLRNVFNLYGNNIVKNMIPTSRPFKIKSVSHIHMNKNKHKDHFRTLINVYTLRFKDIQLENDYKLDKNKKQYYENGHWYKVVFILLLLFYIGGYLIEYFVQKAWLKPLPLYSMVPTLLLSCVLVVCIVVSFNHRLFIRFINQILYSLVIFMISQHVANRFLVKSISWLHPVLFPIFTFVILRLSFVLSVISNVVFFIGTVVAVTNNVHVLPLFIGINIFVGFVGYELEFKSRRNFIMEFSVLNYRKKQSELLNTMLPKTVVSKMINAKLNENGIPVGFEAESHQNVCVIFADVYNFQNLVATIEPHKLVEIMDNLFLSFDRCSKEFGAVKIETVSETYLTSIGLNHSNDSSENANGMKDSMDELERGKAAASLAIDMAIAMLQIASTMKINNNDSIGVKIGINTGYVISGLVGAKKPQYALFGDTVNTASRMKMTGEVGKIHISESTYEFVKDDKTLEFTSRQTQVKGKGLMNTYLLEKAIGTNYPDFSSGSTIHEVDIYFNLMKNRTTKAVSTGSIRTVGHSGQSHSSSDEVVATEDGGRATSSPEHGPPPHSIRSSNHSIRSGENSSRSEHLHSLRLGESNNSSRSTGHASSDVYLKDEEEDNMLSEERDMERIRNRRININRAVGNEEDEITSFGYEPMYTTNYATSIIESATCFDKFKGFFRHMFACCSRNRRRTIVSSNSFKVGDSRRFFSLSKSGTKRFTNRLFSIGNNRYSGSSSSSNYNVIGKGITRPYSVLSKGYSPFSKSSNGLGRGQHKLRKGLTLGRRTFSIASAKAHKRLSRLNTMSQGSHKSDVRDKEVDGIQMKRTETIFLKFRDKLQEDRYRNNFYNSPANVEVNEYALFIFLITFIVQSIINVNIPRIYHKDGTKLIIFLNYILYWTVRCFFIVISFCLWLLFHYRFFSRDDHNKVIKLFTFFLNLLFVMATCVFALSNSWSIKRTEEVDGSLWLTSDSIEFYFYLILLHHSTGMLFQNCLLIDSLFLVMSMTFISSSVQATSTTVTALFTIPICVLFNLLSAHCKESIDRKTFFTNEKAYMIETRINQILNEMLPKSILEEFKQEKLKMSYVHNNMSFLFSDICGFTSWANSVDPSEVIALLQKLFANFDRNTTNFNLYKLCTIGDAYVAISEPYLTNTNDMRLNDLLNILQMAYSMLHIIQETRELFNIPDLNMRIGLHYGSCIGGVIGSGRLRYDVWGTDIYTANMIESNGIPGKVCVSESLKDILSTNFPNRFSFKFHKDVNVIDKVIKSYVIEYDSRENF
ncbi:guanylyl cyclase [Theileria orientalis]|uniref:Guanylyl cyclase n=1 Tax=Theileria orientalis TaxID=68886 RepID=A0A976MC49_THEOR|nr:guanylyl cyclase [Theileria orientalis]